MPMTTVFFSSEKNNYKCLRLSHYLQFVLFSPETEQEMKDIVWVTFWSQSNNNGDLVLGI